MKYTPVYSEEKFKVWRENCRKICTQIGNNPELTQSDGDSAQQLLQCRAYIGYLMRSGTPKDVQFIICTNKKGFVVIACSRLAWTPAPGKWDSQALGWLKQNDIHIQ